MNQRTQERFTKGAHMDLDLHSIAMPALTFLGCVTAYIFAGQKGFSSQTFLKKFFPGRSAHFYFRADFFLSVVVGTGIGFALYLPHNVHSALAAGIGWTAAFSMARAERRTRAGAAGD